MNIKLKGLVTALVLIAGQFFAQTSQAYCIENYSDIKLNVVQLIPNGEIVNKGMWTNVSPASVPGAVARAWFKNNPNVPKGDANAAPVPGTACCNWKNKDCNPSKRQNTILEAEIFVMGGGQNNMACGKVNDQDNMAVRFPAGGRVLVENNPKFNPNQYPTTKNPRYIVKVLNVEDVHIMTYPCPGAPRRATWQDLIPDWSDVVAG